MILCGAGRSTFNYGLHSDDVTRQKPEGQNPHGGGMATVTFNLQVLFDQHERHMNTWSYPNDQLDLARYKGCKFSFFRHPDTDYIAVYDTVPPMKMDEYTSPNTHPAFLLQAKKHIIIPSFKTRPFGKKKVTVRVGPPKLFEDKWYTQQDLCKVNLVSWRVAAMDLRFPFCSPQTDNPCVTIQVLDRNYNEVIGSSIFYNDTNKDKINKFEKWLYESSSHYQTFATETRYRPPNQWPDGSNDNTRTSTVSQSIKLSEWKTKWEGSMYKTKVDSNYGYCNYNMSNQLESIKNIRKTRFDYLTTFNTSNNPPHMNTTFAKGKIEQYEYHNGWFSNVFIGSFRYNLQFRAAYLDVTYNPTNDKGTGNLVWFQYTTKPTTELDRTSCKCIVEDIPLYAALFGYADYVQRTLGPFLDTETVGLVCVRCPYTDPPLQYKEKDKENWGFVFYDTNFGNGKNPDGTGQVHVYWMSRWRPYMQFQHETMNKISRSGPFSYRDLLPSTTLTAEYKFYFNWGGDSLFPQVIKNPCPTNELHPHSSRGPRSLQVVSPTTMGPEYIFHKWDWRRGFFNAKALKRMLEKSDNDDNYPTGPKLPRWLPPTGDQEQEKDSDSQAASTQSSQEEAAQEVLQTLPEVSVQQYLLQQYREQRLLGKQLQLLMLQVSKTQGNLHINPRALGLA